VAREGPGETRPRTGRAREDRPGRRATSDDGSGSHRRQAGPEEGCLKRQREPLPTRVQGLPSLPAAYSAALDRSLEILALRLDTRTRRAIDDHVRLLMAWNRAINLTAVRDPVAIAIRHVADSLSGVSVLRRARSSSLLDLGSGGGFPGLPLALAVPIERTLLVDSVGKKTHFLDVAVEALGVGERVTVAPARAENLAAERAHREQWSAVTARAVGTLADVLELAFPLLAPGGLVLAWKGALEWPEVAAAERAITALGGGGVEIVEGPLPDLPGHRLVVITKRGPTPGSFPREPAVRRRRPL
jgi:16S rRNA (guanine527-N7)-methyltransferase